MLYAIKHGSDIYVSQDRPALRKWAEQNLPWPRLLGERLEGFHIEFADPALFPVFESDGFRFHFPV